MSSPSSAAVARVLVVEDEPMLRESVVTGLSRLNGVAVTGVGTVTAALAEITARPPAVVISDIDLPDRSGIELLGELGARGLKPYVVFVSAYVNAYRAQIPRHAGVEVMEKPVTLEALRALVQQRAGVVSDSSSPFGVADYLQLATLGRHSVVLEVGGSVTGTIIVVSGEAWGAQDARGTGIEAFRRLALAAGVMVRCQTLVGDAGPRNLTGSGESLLLECARLADEASRQRPPTPVPSPASLGEDPFAAEDGPPAPPPEAPPAPAPPPARSGPTFELLFERGVEASLARQHQAALDAFRLALELRPDDPKTRVNIQRLEKLIATKE